MSNEWEARARATKAYKIARVLHTVAEVTPEGWEPVTADEWRVITEELRHRIAVLAKVNPPSDATWQAAVDVLVEMRTDD